MEVLSYAFVRKTAVLRFTPSLAYDVSSIRQHGLAGFAHATCAAGTCFCVTKRVALSIFTQSRCCLTKLDGVYLYHTPVVFTHKKSIYIQKIINSTNKKIR